MRSEIKFPPVFNIERKIPLSDFTNIRIGGPADFLSVIKDQNTYCELFRFCREAGIPFLALGSGTNVFFPETGYHGIVTIIKFDRIDLLHDNRILAEAGVTLDQIHDLCIREGLTGFEFASGIPGTIGGAVYGNAGAYGSNVGNLLIRARILTMEGKIISVDNDYFKFSYRHSDLKINPAIILQAEFQLHKGDSQKVRSRCSEIINIRKEKLPPEDTHTAGSWFKNLKDEQGNATAAAKYLDAVGARQMSVGDAAVHIKHANIFYNRGNATASDMLKLEEVLQDKVFKGFGIRLEREVMYLT